MCEGRGGLLSESDISEGRRMPAPEERAFRHETRNNNESQYMFALEKYLRRKFFYLSVGLEWNRIHYYCGQLLAYSTGSG
jgi:hypothetical protein